MSLINYKPSYEEVRAEAERRGLTPTVAELDEVALTIEHGRAVAAAVFFEDLERKVEEWEAQGCSNGEITLGIRNAKTEFVRSMA